MHEDRVLSKQRFGIVQSWNGQQDALVSPARAQTTRGAGATFVLFPSPLRTRRAALWPRETPHIQWVDWLNRCGLGRPQRLSPLSSRRRAGEVSCCEASPIEAEGVEQLARGILPCGPHTSRLVAPLHDCPSPRGHGRPLGWSAPDPSPSTHSRESAVKLWYGRICF